MTNWQWWFLKKLLIVWFCEAITDGFYPGLNGICNYKLTCVQRFVLLLQAGLSKFPEKLHKSPRSRQWTQPDPNIFRCWMFSKWSICISSTFVSVSPCQGAGWWRGRPPRRSRAPSPPPLLCGSLSWDLWWPTGNENVFKPVHENVFVNVYENILNLSIRMP